MLIHDLRVAIYARVSSERQAKEDTIASQLEALDAAHSRRRPWTAIRSCASSTTAYSGAS